MEKSPKYAVQARNLRQIIDREYEGNVNRFAKALGFASAGEIDLYVKGHSEIGGRGRFHHALVSHGYDPVEIKTDRPALQPGNEKGESFQYESADDALDFYLLSEIDSCVKGIAGYTHRRKLKVLARMKGLVSALVRELITQETTDDRRRADQRSGASRITRDQRAAKSNSGGGGNDSKGKEEREGD